MSEYNVQREYAYEKRQVCNLSPVSNKWHTCITSIRKKQKCCREPQGKYQSDSFVCWSGNVDWGQINQYLDGGGGEDGGDRWRHLFANQNHFRQNEPKPGLVLVWGCVSNLTQMYVGLSGQHMLPSSSRFSSSTSLHLSTRRCKTNQISEFKLQV